MKPRNEEDDDRPWKPYIQPRKPKKKMKIRRLVNKVPKQVIQMRKKKMAVPKARKIFKYHVVKFLDKPSEDVDDYVCVPYSWIYGIRQKRRTSNKSYRMSVIYPRKEDPIITKYRVRSMERYHKNWKFYLAELKFRSDTYQEAKAWITKRLNDGSSEEEQAVEDQTEHNMDKNLLNAAFFPRTSTKLEPPQLNLDFDPNPYKRSAQRELTIKQPIIKIAKLDLDGCTDPDDFVDAQKIQVHNIENQSINNLEQSLKLHISDDKRHITVSFNSEKRSSQNNLILNKDLSSHTLQKNLKLPSQPPPQPPSRHTTKQFPQLAPQLSRQLPCRSPQQSPQRNCMQLTKKSIQSLTQQFSQRSPQKQHQPLHLTYQPHTQKPTQISSQLKSMQSLPLACQPTPQQSTQPSFQQPIQPSSQQLTQPFSQLNSKKPSLLNYQTPPQQPTQPSFQKPADPCYQQNFRNPPQVAYQPPSQQPSYQPIQSELISQQPPQVTYQRPLQKPIHTSSQLNSDYSQIIRQPLPRQPTQPSSEMYPEINSEQLPEGINQPIFQQSVQQSPQQHPQFNSELPSRPFVPPISQPLFQQTAQFNPKLPYLLATQQQPTNWLPHQQPSYLPSQPPSQMPLQSLSQQQSLRLPTQHPYFLQPAQPKPALPPQFQHNPQLFSQFSPKKSSQQLRLVRQPKPVNKHINNNKNVPHKTPFNSIGDNLHYSQQQATYKRNDVQNQYLMGIHPSDPYYYYNMMNMTSQMMDPLKTNQRPVLPTYPFLQQTLSYPNHSESSFLLNPVKNTIEKSSALPIITEKSTKHNQSNLGQQSRFYVEQTQHLPPQKTYMQQFTSDRGDKQPYSSKQSRNLEGNKSCMNTIQAHGVIPQTIVGAESISQYNSPTIQVTHDASNKSNHSKHNFKHPQQLKSSHIDKKNQHKSNSQRLQDVIDEQILFALPRTSQLDQSHQENIRCSSELVKQVAIAQNSQAETANHPVTDKVIVDQTAEIHAVIDVYDYEDKTLVSECQTGKCSKEELEPSHQKMPSACNMVTDNEFLPDIDFVCVDKISKNSVPLENIDNTDEILLNTNVKNKTLKNQHIQSSLIAEQQMLAAFGTFFDELASNIAESVQLLSTLQNSLCDSNKRMAKDLEIFHLLDDFQDFSKKVTKDVTNNTEDKLNIKKFNKNNKQNETDTDNTYQKRDNTLVLPPEYDPKDSKWTLKHREFEPGLIDLIPGSHVYVNEKRLKKIIRLSSKDSRALARMLLTEVFSMSALRVCSFTGKKAWAYHRPVRPGLDENARCVMLSFIDKLTISKKGWKTYKSDVIKSSLVGKMKVIRDKI